MLLEIILFTILGLVVGIIAGLIPGLHPNTVFTILMSFSVALVQFPVAAVISFVVSVSISNVFLNFLPSVFLGAPEDGTELAVLPGHKMLMEGKGYEAVSIIVMGGLATVIL